MTHSAPPLKPIDGEPRSIRALLSEAKYSVDYYQREYRWETKHIDELLADLVNKFRESHIAGNPRGSHKNYDHYFLGSIIVCGINQKKFLVDGQQRITTLTLLLIFLRHALEEAEDKGELDPLIRSRVAGVRSFNLNVDERTPCMEALFDQTPHPDPPPSDSVENILARYQDLTELFPDNLLHESLPLFVDWLLDNVHMIEIVTYSDADAYTIFETMNDRGLSLTPSEMLKGYLLKSIDIEKRIEANNAWRSRFRRLGELGKGEGAEAVKALLRSQYALTIRERKSNAEPRDFDLIGTEFHRWVRRQKDHIGLRVNDDFFLFITREFEYYGSWYERLRRAGDTLTEGLECVHFNAQHRFTLQYPLLLSPIRLSDDECDALRKVRIVASFLDIFICRRIWNWRSIDYSTMQYAMFSVMKKIRAKSIEELLLVLGQRLDEEKETFAKSDWNASFGLHGTNGPRIHRLLARMTDYVETASGQQSRYAEYARRGHGGYEIEHIWADHADLHKNEFRHSSEFAEYRNRIGGLLLLPKSFNASYGDLPYDKKRDHYLKHNLLAQSLHEKAYERDPGFLKFIERTGLEFRHHKNFGREDLDARQELYRQLAAKVWDPNRLKEEMDD